MASAFDQLCVMANGPIFSIFGDLVTVDGVDGSAVVMPETDIALGGGTQLINGAHLMIRVVDFPGITYHSEVVHGGVTYRVMEMDDIDSSGVRRMRMALQ